MTWIQGNKVTIGWLFAGLFAFGVVWIVSGDKIKPQVPKVEVAPAPVKCPPPRVIIRKPNA